MKKSKLVMLLTSMFVLGSGLRCSQSKTYTIGNEKVTNIRDVLGLREQIIVTKPDGKEIKYKD